MIDAHELGNADIIRRLIKGQSNYVYVTNVTSYVSVYTGLVGTGTTGTNVTMTLNSNGLALSVNSAGAGGGDWSVATQTGSGVAITTGVTNTLYHGKFLTTAMASDAGSLYQSAGAYLTTAMASDAGSLFQSTGAYLTTAAQSGHTHSDLYQSTGAYLTTAAQSGHTHSDLYQSTGAYLTTGMASDAGTLFQSTGAYLTTAAQSDHTHAAGGADWATSGITGSGISVITGAATNTIQYGPFITTAAASNHTHDYQSTGAYLTTAAQSVHTHDYQSTGAYLTTAAQSGHTHSDLYQVTGAYLTTAAVSNHTHSDLYLPLGNSTAYATSVLSGSFQTTGAYLTTAAVSNHTHSDLYQSTGAYLTTAMASNQSSAFAGTSGSMTGGAITVDTSGVYVRVDPSAGGFADSYYFCEDDISVDEGWTDTPHWHELEKQDDGGAVGSHDATTTSYTEMDRYVTHALNTTVIPGGNYRFLLYCKTTAISGKLRAQIYRVDSTGTIVGAVLGTCESATFNHTSVTSISFSGFIAQQSGWALTDRIGIIISGKKVGAPPATVTFYHDRSSGYVSEVILPTEALHNQLAGLNDGNSYLHLSSAEKALLSNTSNYAGINSAITGGSMTLNTSGLSINLPSYLTTAAASNHTHDYQSTGAYLTTAAVSNHTHDYQSTGAYLTTAMQSASSSVFAKTGFSTGSITGSDLKGTQNTDGLSLGVPAWLTAAAAGGMGLNTAGTNITWTANSSGLSIDASAYLTTAAASNHTHSDLYQATGAYLTTAAASNHTHDYQSTGAYLTTAAVSNHTHDYQSTGAYLTTAAQSGHSHGDISFDTKTGTAFTYSSASNGLSISHPIIITNALTTAAASNHTHDYQSTGAYLTTAAASNHTHDYQSTGAYLTTAMQSASSSVFAKTGATTNTTSGTDIKITQNTDGLSLAFPKAITTAMASQNTSLYAGTGTTIATTSGVILKVTANSDGLNISYPAALTTAAASNHTHSDLYQATGAYLTTAMQSACTSVFAGVGATSASTAGTDFKFTINTAGLNVSYPKVVTTAAGTGLTLATQAGTAMNITYNSDGLNVSYPKALTTAAASDHTHSNLYQSTGAYLTTAAASNHTHSDKAGIGTTIGATNGTLLKITLNSDGLNASVPAYLTTAAASDHAHAAYLTTAMQSASSSVFAKTGATTGTTSGTDPKITHNTDGLSFAFPKAITTAMASENTSLYVGLATTIATTSGAVFKMTLNTAGINISYPNALTTAAASDHTHSNLYQSTGAYLTTAMQSASSSVFAKTGATTATTSGTDIKVTHNTDGLSLNFPAALTTAAASNHSHGNPTLNLTNLTGTTASASNGLTLSLSGPSHGNLYFLDSNGHSFSSSVNGVSTSIYIKTS